MPFPFVSWASASWGKTGIRPEFSSIRVRILKSCRKVFLAILSSYRVETIRLCLGIEDNVIRYSAEALWVVMRTISLPHNLIPEIGWTKYLVEYQLKVVTGGRVAVKVK